MIVEAVEHLVRGIVDSPDDVSVKLIRPQRRGRILRVRVNGDDMGRVIGRNGRTANALRTVVDAIDDGRGGLRLDFVDQTGR